LAVLNIVKRTPDKSLLTKRLEESDGRRRARWNNKAQGICGRDVDVGEIVAG